jgi:hypothetical protein
MSTELPCGLQELPEWELLLSNSFCKKTATWSSMTQTETPLGLLESSLDQSNIIIPPFPKQKYFICATKKNSNWNILEPLFLLIRDNTRSSFITFSQNFVRKTYKFPFKYNGKMTLLLFERTKT